MDAPTREDFSLYGTTKTLLNASELRQEARDQEELLRLDFQRIVRRYARKGLLFASQATLVQALRSQYPLITTHVVERRIKQDPTLMRIGQYRKGVHGTPYLVLSVPSRSSVARRKAVALKMLLRLVEKRKSSPLNIQASPESARYGRDYRKKRAFLVGKLLFEGSMPCTRCGKAVRDGQTLHLDHVDGSDTEIAGWAHPWCNMKHQMKARLANWFRPNIPIPVIA